MGRAAVPRFAIKALHTSLLRWTQTSPNTATKAPVTQEFGGGHSSATRIMPSGVNFFPRCDLTGPEDANAQMPALLEADEGRLGCRDRRWSGGDQGIRVPRLPEEIAPA